MTYFFLNGFARTGKTFLYTARCNYFWTQNKIFSFVSYSSVAALLFPGRKTSHTTFKIPIDIKRVSECYISTQLILAGLLKETTLIA